MSETLMNKIISLAKRRGFIYPGSLIYGGLAGFWDYGPLGVELKRNIENLWWEKFVLGREDIYGLDTSIIMNREVWEASGHAEGFADPMVECRKCKKRFRVDTLEEKNCPECKGEFSEEKRFNMMFETSVGASKDENSKTYLRPETAQGIFVNFKNIIDSFSPSFPFGIAQTGKAFRNEISPRDFLFRSREFEQMEIEYFVREGEWEKYFEEWLGEMREWNQELGLSKVDEVDVPEKELAHYSKKTIDFEYEFPFGKAELYGLAYRTDFDLKNHSKEAGVELVYQTPDGEKFTPHCLEPTFGLDRTVFALLSEHYNEDEERIWLSLPYKLAPVKAAVFPLLRNKDDLVRKGREVYEGLKAQIPQITWDDHGNIGKRYRRQDEIGTPFCITVDFDTLEDDTVTIRERDSMEQERISVSDLADEILKRINNG